jgi:hypothetical protein
LILDGATTAGEDFVLLSPGKPPIAFALYDTLKLTGMATKVFPEIVAAAANPDRADDEKARIHLLKVLPDRIRPAIPLDAILTLRLGHGGNTHIRPSGPLSAMQALAPSSAFLLRIQMKETLSRIASIARCLPCFEVDLSGNPKEAAQTIAAFASEIPQ